MYTRVPLQIHIKQLAKEDGIGVKFSWNPKPKGVQTLRWWPTTTKFISKVYVYTYIYMCVCLDGS